MQLVANSHRVVNAAEDDATCDICGEPNRTGTSVTYVRESWCSNHRLTYSEGLKMCIWCRHTVVFRKSNQITMPDYEDIQKKTERLKEIKEAGGYLNYQWNKIRSFIKGESTGGSHA